MGPQRRSTTFSCNIHHVKAAAVAIALASRCSIHTHRSTATSRLVPTLSIPIPAAKLSLAQALFLRHTTNNRRHSFRMQSIPSAAHPSPSQRSIHTLIVLHSCPHGWQSTSALACQSPSHSLFHVRSFTPAKPTRHNRQMATATIHSSSTASGSAGNALSLRHPTTQHRPAWLYQPSQPPIGSAYPTRLAILSYNIAPTINTISGMGWFQALASTPSGRHLKSAPRSFPSTLHKLPQPYHPTAGTNPYPSHPGLTGNLS